MKKIVYFLPILLFSCGTTKQLVTKSTVVEVSSQKAGYTLKYKVEEKNVAEILKTLSSDNFEGREAGEPGIEKAAVFLEEFLKNNNVKPYFETYRDKLSNFDKPTFNIVGYIEGNDPILKKEFLVLGGHYDHIGLTSDGDDKINNGANDDASGVTAVAEIAKYFSESKSNKRSILVVFFSAEEKGLLGSKHLAKKLKTNGFNLYTMLNFEMIGVPMTKDYTAYLTGFSKSNMAAKMNDYAGRKLIGYLPQELEYELFSRSDNYSFYNEFKVPSQTVCTFDFENFNYYHDVKDEFELMNIQHMTSFIQDILPVVEQMTNTATKEIKIN
ncbi:M20/M25/M40 family metallo-hydrolase [Flavobacterium sp.]|uniref:M20/M25/M40 family metallo-hydrolase n=1 Tax=Flavobacterium sp. TaxID=239 RepID=UPI0037518631